MRAPGQDERNLVGAGRTESTPVDIGPLVRQALGDEGSGELSPVIEAGRSTFRVWLSSLAGLPERLRASLVMKIRRFDPVAQLFKKNAERFSHE